ncbi:CLUMA_CG003952, isoform A [Clunio marinus]|uniref:CLUMA_CG003952, isoform A n=1 Tax=Clunio marinus TaxID=568069 RepID=A0A1J1HQB6_9DIPT|nr:CLUMA_CG003952, isoform A [Clunio marinus]
MLWSDETRRHNKHNRDLAYEYPFEGYVPIRKTTHLRSVRDITYRSKLLIVVSVRFVELNYTQSITTQNKIQKATKDHKNFDELSSHNTFVSLRNQ